MARINVEDSLFKDVRFLNLIGKMGSTYEALGALVFAWILAQRWYKTEEKLIPKSEWQKQNIPNAIIEVGLAEVLGDKIRMRGSEDQFKWLAQRIQAGRENIKKSKSRSLTVANGRSTSLLSSPYSLLNTHNSNINNDRQAVDVYAFLKNEWKETLKHFGVTTRSQQSDIQIGRLAEKYGADELRLAMVGMRCEVKTDKFDPAKFLSLTRINDKNFERFRNLGAAHIEAKRKNDEFEKLKKEYE